MMPHVYYFGLVTVDVFAIYVSDLFAKILFIL